MRLAGGVAHHQLFCVLFSHFELELAQRASTCQQAHRRCTPVVKRAPDADASCPFIRLLAPTGWMSVSIWQQDGFGVAV